MQQTTKDPSTMMNESHKVVLDRALKQLAALTAVGVEYAVRTPDGAVLGTLKIAPPELVKPPKLRLHNFRQYGYLEKVRAMNAGDSIVIEIPSEFLSDKKVCESFACAISSACAGAFGPGNFATARSADTKSVEVICIDKVPVPRAGAGKA